MIRGVGGLTIRTYKIKFPLPTPNNY